MSVLFDLATLGTSAIRRKLRLSSGEEAKSGARRNGPMFRATSSAWPGVIPLGENEGSVAPDLWAPASVVARRAGRCRWREDWNPLHKPRPQSSMTMWEENGSVD